MQNIFIIILILILFIIFFINKYYNINITEKFIYSNKNFGNDPNIVKYNTITDNTVITAINPTPFINCTDINDLDVCVDSGCNWYGNYCSAMYPSNL